MYLVKLYYSRLFWITFPKLPISRASWPESYYVKDNSITVEQPYFEYLILPKILKPKPNTDEWKENKKSLRHT